jgi:hypothetical protein
MSMFGLYQSQPSSVSSGQPTQVKTDEQGHLAIVSALQAITLRASAAATVVAGATGTPVSGLGQWKRLIFVCAITASATEAGDTLDVYVDASLDNVTYYNAVHFTQQAGNAAAKTEIAVLNPAAPGAVVINVTADANSGVVRPAVWGLYYRARWTVVEANANANASHTFSVIGYAQG